MLIGLLKISKNNNVRNTILNPLHDKLKNNCIFYKINIICILFVLKPCRTCGTRICPTYRSLVCHLLTTPTHCGTTIITRRNIVPYSFEKKYQTRGFFYYHFSFTASILLQYCSVPTAPSPTYKFPFCTKI